MRRGKHVIYATLNQQPQCQNSLIYFCCKHVTFLRKISDNVYGSKFFAAITGLATTNSCIVLFVLRNAVNLNASTH